MLLQGYGLRKARETSRLTKCLSSSIFLEWKTGMVFVINSFVGFIKQLMARVSTTALSESIACEQALVIRDAVCLLLLLCVPLGSL